jgi:hypothetical protein
MPIALLADVFGRGVSGIPYLWTFIKLSAAIGVVTLLKLYFAGAKCRSERLMHGKVVMVTVRTLSRVGLDSQLTFSGWDVWNRRCCCAGTGV